MIATPAEATRYGLGGARAVHIAGPWVIVLERGLTILDARMGAVLRREPDSDVESVTRTPTGFLLSAARSQFGRGERHVFLAPPDVRERWQARCGLWHVADGYLICAEGASGLLLGPVDSKLHAVGRSLADGRVLWRHDIGGSRGEALDARGRLMIATEDHSLEDYERGRRGVTRVQRLVVLDLPTGRVLAETAVPGSRLHHWHNAQNYQFDGERVTLRLRNAAAGECPDGSALRTYTLDQPGQAFVASDECEPPRDENPRSVVASPEPPQRTILARVGEAELSWWFAAGGGYVVERRTPQARWQAITPGGDNWQPRNAWEAEGLVVLMGVTGSHGTLDAFDAESGTPLWRYVFLTSRQLLSTHGLGPGRTSYVVQGLYASRDQLSRLRANPPAGFSVVHDLDPSDQGQVEGEPGPSEAPVLVDPATPGRAEIAGVWLRAWAPVAVLAMLSLALARSRKRAPRTARRALLASGLAVTVLTVLYFFSGDDFLATVALKVVAPVTLVQAFRAAWALETPRFKWPLRAALTIALLAMVPIAFILMLQA